MARAYDQCIIDMGASGAERGRAQSACMAAFWSQYGMTPDDADQRGFDPDEDLCARAEVYSVCLSKGDESNKNIYRVEGLRIAEIGAEWAPVIAGWEDPDKEDDGDPDDRDASSVAADPASTEAPEPDAMADPVLPKSPTLWREVNIIKPGTYYTSNGIFEPTLEDCQMMVANFVPGDPVPIQVSHSMNANDTSGWVYALTMRGEWVVGLLQFVGVDPCTKVLDGRWRKVSGGFNAAPGNHSVFEVSVTPFPACEPAAIDRREIMSKPGEKPTVAAPAATAAETAPEAPVTVAASAPATTVTAEATISAAHNVEIEALNVRLAAVEAREAEGRRLLRLQADLGIVKELARTGKSIPALCEADGPEMKFIAKLSEAQRDDYVALRKSLPNAWPEGPRLSAPPTAIEPGATEETEQQKRMMAKAVAQKLVKTEAKV